MVNSLPEGVVLLSKGDDTMLNYDVYFCQPGATKPEMTGTGHKIVPGSFCIAIETNGAVGYYRTTDETWVKM